MDSKVTPRCNRAPFDGLIDWTQSAQSIYAFIRALRPPSPGAFTYLETTKLFIEEARPVENPPRYEGRGPGRVVGAADDAGTIDVLTGDGVLRIGRWRTAAGETTSAAATVGSTRATLGLKADVLVERINHLEREVAWLRREIQAVAVPPTERTAHAHPCGARAPNPAFHSGGLPSAAVSFGAVGSL